MATINYKITFVIVPGAWHPSSPYGDFASQLQEAGYGVVVATYPSCLSQNPISRLANEIRKWCGSSVFLIEEESKELVLLCHSYGGIPGGVAAFGHSRKERLQEGQKTGVTGLVYMPAFVVPEGMTLLTFLGGIHAPYLIPDTASQTLVPLLS